MPLRCKAGDVAVIVGGEPICYRGVLVTCKTLLLTDDPMWTFEERPVRCPRRSLTGCINGVLAWEDRFLQPLPKLSDAEELLERIEGTEPVEAP